MSLDESQESLASQAAAWVPPWERERPEPSSAPLPDPAPPVDDDPLSDDEEPRDEPEPEAEADAEAGAEPDAEPEPEAEAEPDAEAASEPDGDPGAAAGTPELTGAAEPDGEPDEFEVTVDEPAPEPQPWEAEVDEPDGEELSAEAAGTPAEEAGEEAPAAADGPDPDGAGQLPLEGFAPPPGELPAVQLRAALEAILLVVDEPVAEATLAQALQQPTGRVAVALGQLAEEYEGQDRGFELRRAAGGWRLYTRPSYAGYVERFVLDGQSVRLTQAALETLAVVAYKQPVTRSRISAIRGVNCDGVIRTLVTRGLVEECGTEPETGAHLYRTTGLFLEKLGLDSVDQLPPLAPFLPDELDEIADAQR